MYMPRGEVNSKSRDVFNFPRWQFGCSAQVGQRMDLDHVTDPLKVTVRMTLLFLRRMRRRPVEPASRTVNPAHSSWRFPLPALCNGFLGIPTKVRFKF